MSERPINVRTERYLVRRVAKHWRAQYLKKHGWMVLLHGKSSAEIYDRLAALDAETATALDVAGIIGNSGWVHPTKCNQCGVESWRCVTLGDDPCYESHTADICEQCLVDALAEIRESV